MRTIIFAFFSALLLCTKLGAQVQFKVYHGVNGESKVYDNANRLLSKPIIRMRHGEVFSVQVINPNPLFYNYTLKNDALSIKSEESEITDVLSIFSSIISQKLNNGSAFVAPKSVENYKDALTNLTRQIDLAREYLRKSDRPELLEDALNFRRNAGFRFALDEVNKLSKAKGDFNSPTLLDDLNKICDETFDDSSFERRAFRLLNSSLVGNVNDIKSKVSMTTKTVWEKEFVVTDTSQLMKLVISKNNTNDKTSERDGAFNDYEIVLGTIKPYYKRAILELVPVANFIFSRNVKEIYLQDNIVLSRLKQKTTVSAGMVLNVNFANFGESKEMSVGIGPGYKFNSNSDVLENFYLSTLFSYKNFLRIGLGVGFAQFPSEELKGGVKVGQQLPENINNLTDLIQYEEKPSAFITLSFTGLNLTKKK